jgi:tetratricopeptide (TPR) repeat protein
MTRQRNIGLRFATLAGGVGLVLAGCGSAPTPASKTAGEGALLGESKAGAEQIIPKEKKREISADQKSEFEGAMARYLSAKKGDGLSSGECGSVSAAFKNAADANPGLPEARFNQGAVLQECGREDEAVRVWEGMPKYGPAIANLGYIAWKKGDVARAESLFNRAIEADPLHTVEAHNNLAQILRDKARRSSSEGEKRQHIQAAIGHLRTALALDSNNLKAFSTLAFIYYELNMLEMAKLVGNQAIKKADEIATGKFEEEKTDESAEARGGGDKGEKKGKKGKKDAKGAGGKDAAAEADPGGNTPRQVEIVGTGVTPQIKRELAVVHNTLGLVELKKKNISPAISQFRKAVDMNPEFNEARLNLAALSLNNRDYNTAEENFRTVLKAQPRNYEAMIGLGVALRGNKKIDEAEEQYIAAQKLDPQNPSSYFNHGQKPALQKAQDYYRQFLGKASGATPDGLRKQAEKRIKDIDEIYVALAEAAKLQAEAEEMQKKAEEQQKLMEEQMKKQDAEAAKAGAAAAPAAPAAAGGATIGAPAATEPGAVPAPPIPGTEGKPEGKKKGKK